MGKCPLVHGYEMRASWEKVRVNSLKEGGHWREMTDTRGDTASRVFVCELAAKKAWLTPILP